MTILEARIRRRIFGTRCAQIFRGGDEVFGGDDDVVKLRRKGNGVQIWSLWSERRDDAETDLEVMEWWFASFDELRIMK